MSEWVMLVPSIVFTKIKTDFSQVIKDKYKMTNDNFSTINSSNKDAVFPFVHVHMLTAVEQGQDLEGTSINAGIFTFQIDVIDNKTQNRARNVMSEVLRIMKSMSFDVIAMPEFESGDTHRCIARFRRMIGSGDIL